MRLRGVLPWVCLVVLVVQATLVFRAPDRILDRPLTEDGYYSLTVARNIAFGRGASVDGVRATNGFQPLFTVLTVPLFWIAGRDLILPLRLLLVIHLIVLAATALVVGSIARRAARAVGGPSGDAATGDPFWIAALLYLAGVCTFIHHTNGLETGFYLFLIAVAWRTYQSRPIATLGEAATFGIVLGLVVLARIDGAILVAVLVAGELLRGAASRALVTGAAAAVVSAPWWLYNLVGFGSLMPVSGLAQQQLEVSYYRLERTVSGWLADAVPWIYARKGGSWLADLVRVAVLVPIVAAWPRESSGTVAADAGMLARTRRFAAYLLVFSVALALYYGIMSWATHFYMRYLAPLIPLATVAAALAVTRYAARRRWLVPAVTVAVVGSMVLIVAWLHQGRVFLINGFHNEQRVLVERYVPADAWVAAAQTGTLGYLRERVLNLDGKVNQDAYTARADILGYLDRSDVEWFCDWDVFVESYFGRDPAARGWRPVDRLGKFTLLHRDHTVTP